MELVKAAKPGNMALKLQSSLKIGEISLKIGEFSARIGQYAGAHFTLKAKGMNT